MLITFKTITQETFKLEVDPTMTIGDLKQKICDEKGEADFPVDLQKLIYNGKILQNEQTVEELQMEEKKFIVVMVPKKKVQAPESSQPQPEASQKAEEPKSSEPVNQPSESTNPSATTPQPSVDVTAEQEETVKKLEAMGYPRGEAIAALRAAFFNLERAVEYLCTGIPDHLQNLEPQPVGADRDSDDEGEQDLETLRDHPQFEQLLELIRQHPESLSQILQQMASANPTLMEVIRNNQDNFIRLINGTNSDVRVESPRLAVDNQPNTISLSESDRNAIERLKSLGFSELLVLEAYLACDKNEDLAVDYILSQMDELQNDVNEGN